MHLIWECHLLRNPSLFLLAYLLFNRYIPQLIEEALEDAEDGVKVNGLLVKAVRFADDQAMVSSSNAGLQKIIDALSKTSNDYRIKINTKKDKSYESM